MHDEHKKQRKKKHKQFLIVRKVNQVKPENNCALVGGSKHFNICPLIAFFNLLIFIILKTYFAALFAHEMKRLSSFKVTEKKCVINS